MLTINDTHPLKSACFISEYLLTYLRQKGKYGNRPPTGSRLLMCLDGIIYYNLLYYIIVHWWNIIQLDLLGQTLTVFLNSCLWLSDFCFLNINFKLPDASICVWIHLESPLGRFLSSLPLKCWAQTANVLLLRRLSPGDESSVWAQPSDSKEPPLQGISWASSLRTVRMWFQMKISFHDCDYIWDKMLWIHSKNRRAAASRL